MSSKPRIQGRYESITERASRARLPFLDDADPASAPRARMIRREAPRVSRAPRDKPPSEMAQVVFGSLAPGVQPALDWLGTHNGKKVLATGTVALGALAVTRLLSP